MCRHHKNPHPSRKKKQRTKRKSRCWALWLSRSPLQAPPASLCGRRREPTTRERNDENGAAGGRTGRQRSRDTSGEEQGCGGIVSTPPRPLIFGASNLMSPSLFMSPMFCADALPTPKTHIRTTAVILCATTNYSTYSPSSSRRPRCSPILSATPGQRSCAAPQHSSALHP